MPLPIGAPPPPMNSVRPVWYSCEQPWAWFSPSSPLGILHVAPPSLVMMAEAPFCAMANQVFRVVAASPVSTKNGNHDTPPAGQPAPDVNSQVAPPSVDSAILSAS